MKEVTQNRSKKSPQRKYSVVLAIVLVASALLVLVWFKRNSHKQISSALQSVTIGIQVSPAMTLVMVAEDKGFFRQEGIDVQLKQFTAGKFALQALLGRSVDFAVSGDVPIALATLQGNPVKVVAQVVDATVNEVRVVAVRDGDITDPKKYFTVKRRKLATSFGGGPEFFTFNFLQHYQISTSEVEILSQRPEDMPAALETRSVDAIAIFDPFAYIAEQKMDGKVVSFTNTALYSELYVLAARPEKLAKDPSVVEALLRGLVRAQVYIQDYPDSSKEILQSYTKLDRSTIDGIWKNFSFKTALLQKLVDDWIAEAAWAKESGKVDGSVTLPDFRKVLDDRFLREVDPDAVKLGI
jgi:NitT/TauT family transport system substrate-binding protein